MRTTIAFALTLAATTAQARPAHQLFLESFEAGDARWDSLDGNPIVLATDAAVCSTTYQHETVPWAGGRVAVDLMNSAIAVQGGATYCVSAWIRGDNDHGPALGIREFDRDGSGLGDFFVIGAEAVDYGLNGVAVAVTGDGNWHWYAGTVTLDAGTAWLTPMDELWAEIGGTYADFDDIAVSAGRCPKEYAGPDRHVTCESGTVCMPDGSCDAPPPIVSTDESGGTAGDGSSGVVSTGRHNLAAAVMDAEPQIVSLPTTSASVPGAMVAPAGGCSMVHGVADEGFAMGILCVAMLILLVRGAGRER